jgi:acyl transferase domain-containing protein/NADPH:quinone reductase-like Zn-dependent oxidoreductase/acyl carrier protein
MVQQSTLLHELYEELQIDPDRVAFLEAHGTGTPVGDPIEARAIGQVFGDRRTQPLVIGSIKSNIGHTEAASGLAGVLKAALALKHHLVPPSLHCAELNPLIDFDALNLQVCRQAFALPSSGGPLIAGVNSFGFGGTNAHVVLSEAPQVVATDLSVEPPSYVVLSAHHRAALSELIESYAARVAEVPDEAASTHLFRAAAHRRDRLRERFVAPYIDRRQIIDVFSRATAADSRGGDDFAIASALAHETKVAFAYSGNGGQWAGMGRTAYRENAAFQKRFIEIDELFKQIGGWSLVEILHSADLASLLQKTSIAQPLIFALQAATTYALQIEGLSPSFVFGHSVGEVAAAEAAGILSLEDAVRVIHVRSLHQEKVQGQGGMAVVIGAQEAVKAILDELPSLEIAAFNNHTACTLAGDNQSIGALVKAARRHKVRVKVLDIDYPFHSRLMDPIREGLLKDLQDLRVDPPRLTFISSVSKTCLDGEQFDADYWWRNIRSPVHFRQAFLESVRLGAGIIVEIGPDAVLLPHMKALAVSDDLSVETLNVLDKRETGDSIRRAFAAALAFGADVDLDAAFGVDQNNDVTLVSYPWQRQNFRLEDSPESTALMRPTHWHPLIGARLNRDKFDWQSTVDLDLAPFLADHQIDGQVIFPGTAYIEMGLALARDWLNQPTARLCDLEILQPMYLDAQTSREISCRITPELSRFEISSRPRMSTTPWQVHAVGRIIKDVNCSNTNPALPAHAKTQLSEDTIYAIARSVGLEYGPAFRNVSSASRIAQNCMRIDLHKDTKDPVESAKFAIDIARLDSCFHGLTFLFADRHDSAFVPISFGEVNVLMPVASISSARLDILSANERTIVVSFIVYDDAGMVVVTLKNVRFQAMPAVQENGLNSCLLLQKLIPASEPTAARIDPPLAAEKLRTLGRELGRDATEIVSQAFVLMEGWATAIGWEVLQICAHDGTVDLNALFEAGVMPSAAQNWVRNLAVALGHLRLLEKAGGDSFDKADGVWKLAETTELPDPIAIFEGFAVDHPDHNAELLLMARINAAVESFAHGEATALTQPVPKSLVESFELGGVHAKTAADFIVALLDRSRQNWPKDRALRILQIGYGPLSTRAAALAARSDAQLTIFEPRRLPLERARLSFGDDRRISVAGDFDDLSPRTFDIIIAADGLHRIFTDSDDWQRLASLLADGAVFCALEPMPSLFRDTVFGLDPDWFRQTSAHEPVGAIGGRQILLHNMTSAGLQNVSIEDVSIGAGKGFLAIGDYTAEPQRQTVIGEVLILVDDDISKSALSSSLATLLAATGKHVAIMSFAESLVLQPTPATDVIYLVGPAAVELSARRELTSFCLRLKSFADAFTGIKLRLWFVTQGVMKPPFDSNADRGSGIWAFSRTLANEYHSFDIRRVDTASDMPLDVIAKRLSHLVASGTDETDIVLSARQTEVLRFIRPDISAFDRAKAEALRLIRGQGKGLERLSWVPVQRRLPGAEDVEIGVEATGLNFRDLMWGLGLLPESVLENGFAGPTLGLECAGYVLRVGSKVSNLQPGDAVIAFTKNGFSTHLTLPAALVVRKPEGIDAEAAATIPVAFLTAYHSLITCANLKPGEWVVIHGGAGGVGLAALQIALWRKARVIATASSYEKRALLLQFGAEHVFDSRSGALFDEVRDICPDGVHVVLNSLSGEAMERSIGLLRPFGRFVELGKRDYVANTFIGLRPFQRNLTYFGVDLDQLMVHDKDVAQQLLCDVMDLFEKGHLSPLPYRTFAADEIVDALHLMQQAGHVGKLVVQPPKLTHDQPKLPAGFKIAADKTHLITGGLGGFGIETARWLVEKGAKHLVLVGRSCAMSSDAQAALEGLAARGTDIRIEPCDIADKEAAGQLFMRLAKECRPLAGVFHEAMVLDDALIQTLNKDQIERVLRPKIQGAEVLDRLTSGLTLDYFVLFSSATTIIGNPGQAAYVMANGFMEGMVRRRRQAGLPALAVAWGAIEDVGVLARKQSIRRNLAERAGVKSMTARDALNLMVKALERLPDTQDHVVLAIAPVDWGQARQHLPTLQSPSYALLASDVSIDENEQIDIKQLLISQTPPEVSKLIADEIAVQIARILRLPADDISRNKPLAENGLDSLMAVELALALEKRFGLTAPLTSSASSLTVFEVAEQVLALVTETSSEEDAFAKSIEFRHLGPHFDPAALDDVRAQIFDKSDGLKGILH